MHRRCNLAYMILAGVVITVLTPLMVDIDAQAQIAFVSHRDGNPEIYVMDADGGNLRRFTNNPDKDWTPSWSPDGKRIAFASNRDGQFIDGSPNISAYEIYVMDADGVIKVESLKIKRMTGIPHGLLTVSALPSRLIGRETLKTLRST